MNMIRFIGYIEIPFTLLGFEMDILDHSGDITYKIKCILCFIKADLL